MIKIQNRPECAILNNHVIIRVLLSLMALSLVFGTVNAAAPGLPELSNDITGTSPYIQVDHGTSVTFTATSSGATSYNWFVDGRLNDTHTSPFSMTMNGFHSIAVQGENVDGVSNKTYATVIVNLTMASATIERPNSSAYYDFEGILMEPDLLDVIDFSPTPYVERMGSVFYLFMWFIVGVMIWIRTGKITVPATLGFIMGGVVIGTLPSQYQIYAQVIIVSGFIAAVYVLIREKR